MHKFSRMVLFCVFLLSACSHHQSTLLGYIEGKYVYLSSPFSGKLLTCGAHKGETVTANQMAFKLDPEPELSQLKNAQAQLKEADQHLQNLKLGERSTIIQRLMAQIDEARANLTLAEKTYKRNAELRKTGAVSQAALDQARADRDRYDESLHVAEANLAEAKLGARNHLILAQEARVDALQETVNQYQWMVTQKTVYFSQDGFVQDTLFRQNEFVPAGKPVIQFLPPENRLLIFFVPEPQLSSLKIGQHISFTCDGCQKNLSATITYISTEAQYTPPVIYSKDSKDKLVYWIEASIDPAVVNTMHPGQPVEVEL